MSKPHKSSQPKQLLFEGKIAHIFVAWLNALFNLKL
jgi:hypothetical protein